MHLSIIKYDVEGGDPVEEKEYECKKDGTI